MRGKLTITVATGLVLLGLVITALIFFSKFFRNHEAVYAKILLNRPPNILLNIPNNYVPYWIAEAISIGDKDISFLGGFYSEVVDKEIYEVPNYGQVVFLLIKANINQDKSGIYLYRNKPLSIGSAIDLNLTNNQASGMVTYVGKTKPQKKLYKLRTKIIGTIVNDEVFNNIKVGDESINNKGMVYAKIIDKKLLNPSGTGGIFVSQNGIRSNYDLLITVDLWAEKIGDSYYFLDFNKIKSNEYISLAFPNFSLISYQIVDFIP